MRQVPVHYLRRNERQWAPRAVIALDTETRTIDEDRPVETLRLWHARLAVRGGTPRTTIAEYEADGDSAAHLAAQICTWAKRHASMWLYCHNTNFDLAVTRLPIMLAARGWVITDIAVDSRAPWVRMRQGRHTLTVSDSHTWLPCKLGTVGDALNIVKPPLPDNDDYASWLHRCEVDTLILLRAMLTIMDWWDANSLGNWSVTGAASGWNCMRHIDSPWRIVIDPDPERCEFDRKAIYGGRRSMWQAGTLPPGRYVECDFERAYTVVAATLPLPVRPGAPFASMDVTDRLVDNPRWGIIAECEIETDTPLYPVRHGDRVWYPVGRFRTVLAGPDIAEARSNGHLMAIGSGWSYQLGYALQNWARWCLDMQAASPDAVPLVVKMWLKHTGRAVIGKWAQRSYTREKIGLATTFGWGYEDAWVRRSNTKGSILDIGGEKFLSTCEGEGDNSFPAILAWVESYVRVRLGRAIESLGENILVQCDTDGLICARPSDERLAAANGVSRPLTLRVKTAYRNVEVIGPQHLTLDGKRRWAGVPARAEPDGDGGWVADIWPSLPWQIKHGDRRGYVVSRQVYHVGGTYAPGWVTDRGAVLPAELARTAGGGSTMLPWAQTRWAARGDRLGPYQHEVLRRIDERHGSERDRPDHADRTAARRHSGAGSGPRASQGVPPVPHQPG